jgi:predicted acetyltransferase
MKPKYKVVSPQSVYIEAFSKAYSDYDEAKEQKWTDFYKPGIDDFNTYIAWLSDLEKGINLPEGWVSESTRWLINDRQDIVGFTRLRHKLTPYLEESIGHIGYDVPPSYRKKGYGRVCLEIAIDLAKEIGLEKVLITCDSDNIGSKRII